MCLPEGSKARARSLTPDASVDTAGEAAGEGLAPPPLTHEFRSLVGTEDASATLLKPLLDAATSPLALAALEEEKEDDIDEKDEEKDAGLRSACAEGAVAPPSAPTTDDGVSWLWDVVGDGGGGVRRFDVASGGGGGCV